MIIRHRTSRLAVLCLVAVALNAVVFGGAPSEARSTTGWTPTPGALFNVPRSTLAKEEILENQVLAGINHAQPGSTIRMSMFSFDRTRVSDALLAAHRNRHVNIQVIVNNHEFPRAQRALYRALGQNRVAPSWYYQCRAACRGIGDVQHSKFVLFSQTGAAKDVVMLGSLNMKTNGVINQFNDLLTVNSNAALYDDLAAVFDQMKLDRSAKPSFLNEKIGDKYQLYVMPFPRGTDATTATKWTIARDPITRLLAPISCKGASTPSGRTIVRVNMHAWDGSRGAALAREYEDLWRRGCDVKIQVGFAGAGVRRIFAQSTPRGRIPVRSTGFDTDDDGEIDLYSHQKVLEVSGHYGTVAGQKMVVTGSSNYQDGGQYGDELIFRVFGAGVYAQYAKNWQWSWLYHTHGFRTLNSGGNTSLDGRTAGRQTSGPILVDGLGTDSPEWRDE